MNEGFLARELFFVLAVAIVAISFFFSARKTRIVLSKLNTYLPGALSKFPFDPSYKGAYQGLNFTITLTQRGRNSPPSLRISLMKKSSFRLTLYRESNLSELGKKIGVVREVKIHDELFDKEFLILSNKPDRAISFFSNSEMKSAARELLGLGFRSLIINEQGLQIQKVNYNVNTDIEPHRVISAIQKLNILARGCN
ncbi:MAG: hypothetical protein FJZ10_04070 [Candidatus Omnitrophica bacterium]|nr:hypothetical protein [Candidatus Omnitrophota bacterium]